MIGVGPWFDYYRGRYFRKPSSGDSMSTSNYNAQPAVPVKSTLAVAISMALTGQTETAQAQDSESVGLEEITVTARKRETSQSALEARARVATCETLARRFAAGARQSGVEQPPVGLVRHQRRRSVGIARR